MVFVSRHLANNFLKGKAEWNIKNAAELIKPVGTGLIFWDLLECQSNLVSKVFLERPKQGPANLWPFATWMSIGLAIQRQPFFTCEVRPLAMMAIAAVPQ